MGDAAGPPISQEKPQLSIREALAEERRPASPSEVIENIENLRREIAERTDKPLPDTLREYQHALLSGFSKSQLETYISVKGAEAWRQHRQSDVSKKVLVAFIFDRIWGFDTGTLVADSSKPMAASISVSPHKHELIRMTARYAACVSSSPNMLLRYNPAKALLWIYGTGKDIEKMKKTIVEQGTTRTKTFAVTPVLGTLLKTNTAGHSRLQEMMKRLGVLVRASKDATKLQCWAFSGTNLQRFERELICWQTEQQVTASQSPLLSLETLDNVSAVPIYTSTSIEHYRHLSSSTPDRVIFAPRREAGERELEVANGLREALQAKPMVRPTDSLPTAENYGSARFSPDYSVELGQAIFQHNKADQPPVDSPTSHASPVTGFLSAIPLLPQFLAHRLPLAAATSPADDPEISPSTDQTLCITLQPANPDLHPRIEIYATVMPDMPSSLDIQEVSLVSPKSSQILLLPNTPVDLKFSRRDKYILTGRGLPVEQRFAPLLAQIAEQLLKSDDTPTKPRTNASIKHLFNLVLSLDLSNLKHASMDTVATAPQQNGTQGRIRDFDKTSTEADATKKTETAPAKTRYALGSIEAVDAAVYPLGTTPASAQQDGTQKKRAPKLLLEHLSFTQIGLNHAQSRSELVRIVEQPMLRDTAYNAEPASPASRVEDRGMIGSDPKRFQAFVRSAYKTVMELDDFIRKRTRTMAQARQKSV